VLVDLEAVGVVVPAAAWVALVASAGVVVVELMARYKRALAASAAVVGVAGEIIPLEQL